MLHFKVSESANDNGLLFYNQRNIDHPGEKIHLEVDRYHQLLLRQQRIIDLHTYKTYLLSNRHNKKNDPHNETEIMNRNVYHDERYNYDIGEIKNVGVASDYSNDGHGDYSNRLYNEPKEDLFILASDDATRFTGHV